MTSIVHIKFITDFLSENRLDKFVEMWNKYAIYINRVFYVGN